jgi:hypothetical protein
MRSDEKTGAREEKGRKHATHPIPPEAHSPCSAGAPTAEPHAAEHLPMPANFSRTAGAGQGTLGGSAGYVSLAVKPPFPDPAHDE